MKITKINNLQYKIEYESSSIVLYDQVIINNNILYKQKLTKKEVEDLLKQNEYYDIYFKVIGYINKKMRCIKEIVEFIKKYTNNKEHINNIIHMLEENNYLNDEIYAKAYIKDKLYLTNDGPLKIKRELEEKNIYIEDIADIIDKEYVFNKLQKLVQKKASLNHTSSPYVLKQKIRYEMLNLGYLEEDINKAISNIKFNNNIENEYRKLVNRSINDKSIIREKLYKKGYNTEEINYCLNKKDS